MMEDSPDLEVFRSRETLDLELADGVESRPLLGLAVGLAAGFLATFAMDGFQSFVGQVTAPLEDDDARASSGSDGGQDGNEEPSTMKLGRRIGRSIFHRELDESGAKAASEALHYGYGTLMGGIYGLLAELFPPTKAAAGVPYATTLFLLGDEVMVPAMGLSKSPTHYPISTHVKALGAHLAYGVTLDLLRRGILDCIASTRARRAADDDLLWPDNHAIRW